MWLKKQMQKIALSSREKQAEVQPEAQYHIAYEFTWKELLSSCLNSLRKNIKSTCGSSEKKANSALESIRKGLKVK